MAKDEFTQEREWNDRDDYAQEQADRLRIFEDEDVDEEMDTWTESLEEEARLDYIAGYTPGFTSEHE